MRNRILISQMGKLRPAEGTQSSQVHIGISRVRNRVMFFEGYISVLLTNLVCCGSPQKLHNEKQFLTCKSHCNSQHFLTFLLRETLKFQLLILTHKALPDSLHWLCA